MHMLYVDPWLKDFKDCLMLRSNQKNCSDYILEVLPVVFEHNDVVYRRSQYALDFCFCLPCVPCCNIVRLDQLRSERRLNVVFEQEINDFN